MSQWLNAHRASVYSQYGEDGILKAIFERIGVRHRWCVEFGAWDGEYLSNCFRFLKEEHWHAVMIEGDAERAAALDAKRTTYPTLHTIHAFVAISGPQSLDALLATTDTPPGFDLLSIDIDNDDYFVWKGLTDYHPRVVVLEVNSQYGPDRLKLPRPGYRGFTERTGCSFASAVQLAKAKGYELATHTGNCIFVDKESVAKLEIDPDNWRSLFDPMFLNRSLKTRLRTIAGDIAKGRAFKM
jgi:hypothetical protein